MPIYAIYKKSDGKIVAFKPSSTLSSDETLLFATAELQVNQDSLSQLSLKDIERVKIESSKLVYKDTARQVDEAEIWPRKDEFDLDDDLTVAKRRASYSGTSTNEAIEAIYNWAFPSMSEPADSATYEVMRERWIIAVEKMLPDSDAKRLMFGLRCRCFGACIHAIELMQSATATKLSLIMTNDDDKQCLTIVKT